MIEMWNNWGCCCGGCPCHCYAFEDNLESSEEGGTLEKADAAGSHTFVTGIVRPDGDTGSLGKGLKIEYNSVFNRNAVKVDHDDCFSLEGGMSTWFWLYHDATCPPPYTPIQSSQTIRKGDGSATIGSDVPEWIFGLAESPQCDSSSLVSVIYGIGKSGGGVQHLGTNPYGGTPTPPAAHWSFYFMYYDPDASANGTMYISVDAADWKEDELTEPFKANTEPLYIGGKVGQQENYLLIDELGFCKNIGTHEEMKERAFSLYHDGYGKACPAWN
tara:strand:+ start:736 stop:1554 length:819 start_codon:yes stop_codon:yes gene_type:complete